MSLKKINGAAQSMFQQMVQRQECMELKLLHKIESQKNVSRAAPNPAPVRRDILPNPRARHQAVPPPPAQQHTGFTVQHLPTVGPCTRIPGSTRIPPNATDVHIIHGPTARVNPPFGITQLPKSMVELYNQHRHHALSNLDKIDKRHWPNNTQQAYSRWSYLYEVIARYTEAMRMRWVGLEERQRQIAALLDGERGTSTMTQYMEDLK
eukprot:3024800-Ditylum_brightwellii.AAC.1